MARRQEEWYTWIKHKTLHAPLNLVEQEMNCPSGANLLRACDKHITDIVTIEAINYVHNEYNHLGKSSNKQEN